MADSFDQSDGASVRLCDEQTAAPFFIRCA